MDEIYKIKNKIINHCKKKNINIIDLILKYLPNLTDTQINKNYIIDYNNCIDNVHITINLLNYYFLLKKLNINVNSIVNIYSYHWRTLINLKDVSGNHITTAYQLLKCKKIDYKTILIKNEDDIETEIDSDESAIPMDELGTYKLSKKYDFIYANLLKNESLENSLQIEDWFNELIKFVDINLCNNGKLLITIREFTEEVIDMLDKFIKLKKFKNYQFTNITFPTVTILRSTPLYIYFDGYNSTYHENIRSIQINLDIMLSQEYKKFELIYNEIIKINNKKDMKKYIITNTNQYCINMGLDINPVFINKYNYKKWRMFLSEFKKQQINVLEIGVFEGVSSVWFLDNIVKHKDSRLYLVDTWEGSVEYSINFNKVYKTFLKNIEKSQNNNKIIINKKMSSSALMQYINENILFDIIFIDASHDSRDVMLDALLSWKVLKLNGILIFDDYLWKKMPNDYECPKLAIDNFIKLYRSNIKILNISYQLILKKISEY
jgi:predicted O-methyltransferase YrrM